MPLRDFMPLAETTELGRQIDCLSLSLGLKALAEEPSIRLSINMSARSIGYPAWLQTLRAGIAEDERIAERLILEITESSAMGMPRTGRPLHAGIAGAWRQLRAGRFRRRAIPRSAICGFLLDMIKIDGQFIRDINQQRDNQVLTARCNPSPIISTCSVAESVETADDAAFLIDMGIDRLQGYYFGAPTIVPPWRSPIPPPSAAEPPPGPHRRAAAPMARRDFAGTTSGRAVGLAGA